MPRKKMAARSRAPKALVRLAVLVLLLGGLYLAGRWTDPAAMDGRAMRRFYGLAALASTAWYGRYVLLPKARWRALWWLLPPGLTLAVLGAWPLWPPGALVRLGRWLLALSSGLSLAETICAPCRRAAAVCLKDIRARQAASRAIRAQAASVSFLTALAVGAAVYFLSVDYIFDCFLYSLCGCGLVWIGFLGAPAVLADRMERDLADDLDELAQVEEVAVTLRDAGALEECASIRLVLERSARLGWAWRDWLYPLASSALLLLAALLYRS